MKEIQLKNEKISFGAQGDDDEEDNNPADYSYTNIVPAEEAEGESEKSNVLQNPSETTVLESNLEEDGETTTNNGVTDNSKVENEDEDFNDKDKNLENSDQAMSDSDSSF